MPILIPAIGLGWALLGAALAFRVRNRGDRSWPGFLAVTALYAWPLGMGILSQSPAAAIPTLRAFLGIQAVPFLFGPALYGYTGSVMRLRPRSRWAVAIHLAPFLLVNLLEFIYAGKPSGPPSAVGRGGLALGPLTGLVGIANAASMVLYGLATYARVRRYRKDAADYYASDRGSLTLRWLGVLAVANLLIFGVSILILALLPFGSFLPALSPEAILQPPIAVFLFVFVLFAHDQRSLAVYGENDAGTAAPDYAGAARIAPPVDHTLSGSDGAPIRYARSSLTPEGLETLFRELEDYMRRRKPFLDADLDLDRVSRELGYTRHEVSQAINTKTGGNFYAFVNRYRIEAFLEALGEEGGSRPSFAALAYGCGFSSQSSFYAAVKRVTGATPRELATRRSNTPRPGS